MNENPCNYMLDSRTEEELRAEIARLAHSYTPEWLFDTSNPDIGAAIALIFAKQMDENLRRFNRVPDKYRTEFVNLLDLTLLSANPARGVVTMSLIPDTVPGTAVPKGTKLLGEDADGAIIFETVSSVYLTASSLRCAFQASSYHGKILPLLGEIRPPSLTGNQQAAEDLAEGGEELSPFSLFDFKPEGIQENSLLIYHRSLLDIPEGGRLSVRPHSPDMGGGIAELLADTSVYRWSYHTDSGFTAFERVTVSDGVIRLEKDMENVKIQLDGSMLSVVRLEALSPVKSTLTLDTLLLSAEGGPSVPEFVVHGEEEAAAAEFMPFGNTATLFDECFIGHDSIFSQEGAAITLRFSISLREKHVSLTVTEQEDELKIIKRRARQIQYATSRTSPTRIGIDYYNGLGWQRLEGMKEYSTIFDGSFTGDMVLSFCCPADWQPVIAGGFQGRALRIRLLEADNCYLRPCVHTMPVLSNLAISYSYENKWRMPHRIHRISGTSRTDLSEKMLTVSPMSIFLPLPYAENALYLGFDRKWEGSPICMMFDVEDNPFQKMPSLRFDYSTGSGFQRIKTIDHTENMSRTGTVLFLPQPNFAPMTLEGHELYWLRVVDQSGAFNDLERHCAEILRIYMNAVEVHNVRTLPEEPFFIDVSTPNMVFPLAADNILSADVWINEANDLSPATMKHMLKEMPDSIQAGYNYMGEISEFYVRWKETPSFEYTNPESRSYVLDRMKNTIQFGDGLRQRIPLAQTGTAFKVQARCCDGLRGNLPPNSITAPFGQLLYVDTITNPTSTYGGSNLESLDTAHLRGANMISSRNRLVSEQDYIREVKAFSPAINKVKCVVEQQGNRSCVKIALLMEDYREGSQSFRHICDRLKDWLLGRSEMSLTSNELFIMEPVFVEVGLDIWAYSLNMDYYFENQNMIRQRISDYLEPLSDENRAGWEIGVIPKERQLKTLLQSPAGNLYVRNFVTTVRYTDAQGAHEHELRRMKDFSPFALAVNGEHHIHMDLDWR